MSTPPAVVWFFRIIHIDNLEFALRSGLFAGTHPDRDPDYIFIGDTGLTAERFDFPIPLDGNHGNLGEYVPFYLGPRSPMLLNIITGFRGVTKRPQEDIVYLCCRMTDLQASDLDLLLTDGHAKSWHTQYFTPEDDLQLIDWVASGAEDWKDSERDWDLQRRKQAEGMVRNHVPPTCISFVAVKNEGIALRCKQIIVNLNLDQQVRVRTSPSIYY
jgi:hypothetical protein